MGRLKKGIPGKALGRKLKDKKNKEDTYVFDLIRSMEILSTLVSALELGIFDMIAHKEMDLMTEAGKKGYDPHALETLLNVLRVAKFIHKSGSNYELCEITRQIMGNPFLVDNLRLAKIYTALFKYHARVKGKYLHILDSDELQALTALGRHSAKALVDCLTEYIPGLKNKSLSLMDLGCGQGYHLAALALQNPKLRCIGVDVNDEVLLQAAENVKKYGLLNVTLKKANAHEPLAGKPTDVITSFSSIRGMGKWNLQDMTQKVFNSLKAGGYFIIQDFFLENHRKSPIENVFFDLKLALSARGGKVFSLAEFEDLKNVGFKNFEIRPINVEKIPVKNSAFFIYRK
ncbi:MAG: tRNA (adenine(22)-N(1))-methyltransferase TrmK [Acidobacteria bacterium]|nr:tRNA (adenine(22)-N(1))-methyltransferase TrmK [Acidobacteriota bacterium]